MKGDKSGPCCFASTGFSLLELLVIMAIAGLMLTLIPPLFTNALTGAEIRTATRELATALKSTRTTAMTRQQEQVFTLDVARRHFQRQDGGIQTLPESLHLQLTTAERERVTGHVGRIRFYPDGSSTGGRIQLKVDGRQHRIDIDWLTGRITIDS